MSSCHSFCVMIVHLMDPSAENSRVVSVYVLGGLGFIFIALQCQLIYVICVYRDFRSNLTYVIIAIGSITELAQNVSHFYSALCLLFDSPFMFQASKVFGALTVASFSSSVSVSFVLALNRLEVFRPKWIPWTIKDAYLYGLLFIICAASGILFVIACTPLFGFIFSKKVASWMFSGPFASPFLDNSFWINSFALFGTLVSYVIIFFTIVTKRKLITSGNKVSSSEIKLLISAVVQFILVLFCNIALKFQGLPHLFIYANLTLTCGVKPIVHLAVNKKLRKRYFKGLHIPNSNPKKPITSGPQHQQMRKNGTASTTPPNRIIHT